MRSSPRRPWRAIVVLLLLQVTTVITWAPHRVVFAAHTAPQVEAAHSPDGQVPHDEHHCLICQALSLRSLGTEPARLQLSGTVSAQVPHPGPAPAVRTTVSTPGQPRAPPAAIV